ncbi:MAG TPA: DUF4405 domain-containing protein [Spirochaetota bacterium]|nr:DUF4405 domain-containing protein [Spirochaetota bacterium]
MNKNNGRRIVSLLMLFAFIILIPSGIMMHLNDVPGSFGDRHFPMVVHNLSAAVFVITGIFHIKFNFKLVKKYIRETWFVAPGKGCAD